MITCCIKNFLWQTQHKDKESEVCKSTNEGSAARKELEEEVSMFAIQAFWSLHPPPAICDSCSLSLDLLVSDVVKQIEKHIAERYLVVRGVHSQ